MATLSAIFGWRGTVDRFRFAAIGVALIVAKVLVDRQLARGFDREWDWFSYWTFRPPSPTDGVTADSGFLLAFALLAIPFLLAGVSLTFRRLRDAALPRWLVVLFLVPAFNLVFLVTLALVPPREVRDRLRRREEPEAARIASRFVPTSRVGSALVGTALAGTVGLLVMHFGTAVLETYAIGLFVATPFAIGLLSSLVYAYRDPRDQTEMIGVGLLAAGVVGLGMLLLAWEGLLCIIMASPLVLGMVVLGSVTAHALTRGGGPGAPPVALGVVPILLPMLLFAEAHASRTPPLHSVRTSVVIDAPPEEVWKHVVEFPRLDPPTSRWLQLGVAYPVGAKIEGRGVGAIRRCSFSTGDFVEPITTWDEPNLLAFDVRSQPPSMRELSPWDEVSAPHLDGFLRSRKGEFRLVALPGGRTKVIGTTWYENRMWPQPYWKAWSDTLIHDIHDEVLTQVRRTSERA